MTQLLGSNRRINVLRHSRIVENQIRTRCAFIPLHHHGEAVYYFPTRCIRSHCRLLSASICLPTSAFSNADGCRERIHCSHRYIAETHQSITPRLDQQVQIPRIYTPPSSRSTVLAERIQLNKVSHASCMLIIKAESGGVPAKSTNGRPEL